MGTKVGTKKLKLRSVYRDMKRRCYEKNRPEYSRYGGRGITVCDKWLKSFDLFYSWALRSGYEPGLSIDRIDNNGNYEPDNCRWASRRTQMNNTSKNRNIAINGVTYTLSQWAEKYCIKPHTVARRIERGMSPEEALLKPVERR